MFKSLSFSINFEELKKEYSNKIVSLSLFFTMPFYLKNDISYLKTKIQMVFGKIPNPETNTKLVESVVYDRLIQLCIKNNSQPVILCLDNNYTSKESKSLFSLKNVFFAKADSILNSQLKTAYKNEYKYKFQHMRVVDGDTLVVDAHPNQAAHKIIAESILNKIKN